MTVLNMPCNNSLFSALSVKYMGRYVFFCFVFQSIFSALQIIKADIS